MSRSAEVRGGAAGAVIAVRRPPAMGAGDAAASGDRIPSDLAADGCDRPMRLRALELARGFVGTPYRHQGSRRGVGCDCLGLVRGVWRALYGEEPEAPGPYTPDWAERAAGEPLLEAARRHLPAIAIEAALPGDLLLFRWQPSSVAKHCGILDEGGRVIHAYEGHAVLSSPLGPAWRRRIAAAFRFPE